MIGVSLFTTFLAGVVALFAPCCIGFLLPAYLGSVVRERVRVLLLTLLFALGIWSVFLPIGLGIGAIGSLLNRWHDPFFYAGAGMLIVIGALLVFGKNFMIHVPITKVAIRGPGSAYALGVFSGIGTSCCAPVFIGVATLSALSGSALGGAILASAYVLGMVLPLLVVAWAWDRTGIAKRLSRLQRSIRFGIGTIRFETISAHLIAGFIFVISGTVIAWLTATHRIMAPMGWQRVVSERIVTSLNRAVPALFAVPNEFWLFIFISLVAFFIFSAARKNAGK